VASSRTFQHASDSTVGLVEDRYLASPFRVAEGRLDVPHGIGLGVEVDNGKVERSSTLQGEDRVFAYCRTPIRAPRDVDHFVPCSCSGDDGLDSLVAACRRCNNRKRATLPAAPHLADLIERNRTRDSDLESLARKRHWPRDRQRSTSITRTACLHSPDERPLWLCTKQGDSFTSLGPHRAEIERLLM
jgi:5-methylcytosine-specific restriction endonuclease McrA